MRQITIQVTAALHVVIPKVCTRSFQLPALLPFWPPIGSGVTMHGFEIWVWR